MTRTKHTSTLFTQTELSSIDERELVERFQSGDTEAFNPLVLKYQQKIYNLLYLRIGDREAAKDLSQDVFLKAFQALPHFKQILNFTVGFTELPLTAASTSYGNRSGRRH